jgi:hypothetical protein
MESNLVFINANKLVVKRGKVTLFVGGRAAAMLYFTGRAGKSV